MPFGKLPRHNIGMISLLVAGLFLVAPTHTYTLEPTDDIWVYPHASDPSKDPFLRVWGAGGLAVAGSPDQSEEFSYSYLKFDLSSLPKGKQKVIGASLVLTSIADPAYSEAAIKDTPLEARPLRPDFAEKSWEYDIVRSLSPSGKADAVYGAAAPQKWPAGKPFAITIDLTKGGTRFATDFGQALAGTDRVLAIALTSTNDPSSAGSASVYKLYSKDAEKKELHPVLRITVAGE